MAKIWHHLNLPQVRQNPFSIRPLSSADSDLFVGRFDLLSTLKQFILRKSSRWILLTGPYGSGRSSLVRCLEPVVSLSAYIDHLNAANPGQSLLQSIYSQFFQADPPQTRRELSEALVNASYRSDRAPLIVLDLQSGDSSSLHVALRDTSGMLERSQALIILICDQRQRQQLPQELLQPFEEITLSRFGTEEVIQLVSTRLETVGFPNHNIGVDAANEILEATDGYPRSILQLLRNFVDDQYLGTGHEVSYVQQSSEFDARPEPRDEPDMLHKFMHQSNHGIEHSTSIESDNGEQDELQSDIIDASTPWYERDSQFPVVDKIDFDLNLDDLNHDRMEDEPLRESPSVGSFAHEIQEPPRTFSGPFKSLRSRNISAMDEAKHLDSEETILESDEEFELSISTQHTLDGNETALGHEVHFDEEILLDEVSDVHTLHPHVIPNDSFEKNQMELIIQMLSKLLPSENSKSNELPQKVIDMLTRHNMPRLGRRHEYPLNGVALQKLSGPEVYVVSIASKRMFSPSDEEMLEHLNIKRSRLSQISSSLLKAGILTSRMVGRSSMYTLTNAARAQLLIWSESQGGILE